MIYHLWIYHLIWDASQQELFYIIAFVQHTPLRTATGVSPCDAAVLGLCIAFPQTIAALVHSPGDVAVICLHIGRFAVSMCATSAYYYGSTGTLYLPTVGTLGVRWPSPHTIGLLFVVPV
jgi:hypothetical protein